MLKTVVQVLVANFDCILVLRREWTAFVKHFCIIWLNFDGSFESIRGSISAAEENGMESLNVFTSNSFISIKDCESFTFFMCAFYVELVLVW